MQQILILFLAIFSLAQLKGQSSPQLLAWYEFDDSLVDTGPNSYDGFPISNMSSFQEGVKCQALRIENNPASGVQLPHQIVDGLADFTISCWVKLNGLNNSNNFFSGANPSTANALIINYNAVGSYPFSGWHLFIEGVDHPFAMDERMNDLKWHHLVITRTADLARLYLDSELIDSAIPVTDQALSISPNGFFLGQDQDCTGGCFEANQNAHADMDELLIFSGAFGQAGVDALFDVKDCELTSVNSPQREQNLLIYPNPNNGAFSIRLGSDLPYSTGVSIELWDINGRLVERQTATSQQLHWQLQSSIPPGPYLLKVYDRQGRLLGLQRLLIGQV